MKRSRLLILTPLLLLAFHINCSSDTKSPSNPCEGQKKVNLQLEIGTDYFIRNLTGNRTDETLGKILYETRMRLRYSNEDYLNIFEKTYHEYAGNKPFIVYIDPEDLSGDLTPGSSNQEVFTALRKEWQELMPSIITSLEMRLKNSRLTLCEVLQLNESPDRLQVSLPACRDHDRLRRIIQFQGKLEFRSLYTSKDFDQTFFQELDQALALIEQKRSSEENYSDDLDEASPEADPLYDDLLAENTEIIEKSFPLKRILKFTYSGNDQLPAGDPVIAKVHVRDTFSVNDYLKLAREHQLLPEDVQPLWAAFATASLGEEAHDQYFNLYFASRGNEVPLLDGGVVIEAKPQADQKTSSWGILVRLNPEGTESWKQLTSSNIDKSIAMTIDGQVYSAPRIQAEISNGQCLISGFPDMEKATDLSGMIGPGSYPVPISIIAEFLSDEPQY
ncbi:MAG: hypothetical protein JW801_12135 [Bacteroidales bacterium]|nr:hypothetical protein [Bacteroidales bacterium]